MSFNQQIIAGNVGSDPEFITSGNTNICKLSVATSKKWTDKNTGQKQEKTTWHRVVLFNRLAEIARDYVKKGSQVMVVGETEHQKYQDKNTGEDRYSTQVIAREIQLLGGRGDATQNQQPQSSNTSHGGGAPSPAGADFDDDIPF